jgi:hypothetical protein
MRTESNSKAVQEAFEEMSRLAVKEIALESEREQKIQQLAAFRESTAAEREDSTRDFVGKVRDGEIEIEMLERSLEGLRRQRRPAIEKWCAAQSAEQRRPARLPLPAFTSASGTIVIRWTLRPAAKAATAVASFLPGLYCKP